MTETVENKKVFKIDDYHIHVFYDKRIEIYAKEGNLVFEYSDKKIFTQLTGSVLMHLIASILIEQINTIDANKTP